MLLKSIVKWVLSNYCSGKAHGSSVYIPSTSALRQAFAQLCVRAPAVQGASLFDDCPVSYCSSKMQACKLISIRWKVMYNRISMKWFGKQQG